MTNSIPDLEESECILVTGSNTTEQHPIIGTRILRAKENGAKLIVVDPRRIQLALHADLHVRQRPGSDVAWLNGVMNIIINEGLADEEFIKERTEGFEQVKETVAKYTPEKVEEISGISPENLRQIAMMYGKAKSAAIVYSMGITQHSSGVDHVKVCANLAMITGNMGKRGGGVNPLRGQNNVQGACDMGALANVYPSYQKVDDPEVKMKFEKAWCVGGLSDKIGLTVVEMTNAAGTGDVKAMYIMGENPVLTDPDANHVIESLKNLDFLVVQDLFLTQTAELADVVLPGASFAEKTGTFTGTDRRVQLVRQAFEPLGDSKYRLSHKIQNHSRYFKGSTNECKTYGKR
jgi:predicted molibdopterin-dependent oxidoreductase YjgC